MQPRRVRKKSCPLMGAGCTIPTHYDMVQDNTVDPLRFAAALRQLDPSARFALPALGERLIFSL